VVQELDASRFEGALDGLDTCGPTGDRTGPAPFHVADRVDVDASHVGERSLLDAEEGAGRPELVAGCEHEDTPEREICIS
jgi:hypothetical protein